MERNGAAVGVLMSQTKIKLERLVLTPMYCALHDQCWVWKTIPFEITDRSHEQGLIDEPRSQRKSVCLTDLGLERAKAAFNALYSDQSSCQVRSR